MLKKGQRVRINSGGQIAKGGYDGHTATCLEEEKLGEASIKLDIGLVIMNMDYDYLTPVEPSIDNLMVGDVVKDDEGKEISIKFIGNDEFIVGYGDNAVGLCMLTKLTLNNEGYKVISPKPTMEAEEKLNAIIIKE